MTRLVWDQTAVRRYSAGVDRGVFYPRNGPGVVWNGLVSVQESPSDAEEKARYVDGIKTRMGRKAENFEGTIEAFTYPESFYEDVILPRTPKPFNMSYRVTNENLHELHFVYNVLLAPSEKNYQREDDVEPFSWAFTTRPLPLPEGQYTSHIVIQVEDAYLSTLADIEERIYGSETFMAYIPPPAELVGIFETHAIVKVVTYPDGRWSVEGPDDVVVMEDATKFSVDWPSVIYIDAETYSISSL